MTSDPTPSSVSTDAPERVRIAKIIARAGLCSRREAESWILAGRIAVNGETVLEPGHPVTEKDKIAVDGKPLPTRERTRLWLYHKPRGVVTTSHDPEGRPTVMDVLPEGMPRVMTIGRLDINTEGLLLLTNDGGLARVLELPDTGWLRRYRVRAFGEITQDVLDKLAEGVEIDGFRYGSVEAKLDRQQGDNAWLTVGIREGKNREVKRVLEHVGLKVNRLIRASFGPFSLGEMREGAVEEIRSRYLRDQLGPRLIEQADCDFEAPILTQVTEKEEKPAAARRSPAAGKKDDAQRVRAGQITDRKGRKILIERLVKDDPPSLSRKPKRGKDEKPARAWEKKPERTFDRDRPARKFDGERPPRRERPDGERPQRKFDGERPARRDRPEGDRPQRRERFEGERPARQFDGERPKRRFEGEGGGERPQRKFDRPRTPRVLGADGEEPARAFRTERPARKFDGERPPRKFDGERTARKFDGERPPRRERPDGERPARKFEGERSRDEKPARTWEKKPERKFDGERPPRRDRPDGEHPARKFEGDRPPRKFDGERAPRQDRPPRKFDGERPAKAFDGERPKRRFEDDRKPRGGKPPFKGGKPGGGRPQGNKPRNKS